MIKTKKNQYILILSFIFLSIINIFSNADITYAKPNLPAQSREFYIYDEAEIMDSDLENYIISVNKELEEKTGAQVVVASVNSLEGLDINTYATSLFEKWKIGSSEYDNGLLILIVATEGNMWIETGYGLEGALPAGRLKTIIERDMIPSFKNDNYNEGIEGGFNSIINYIEKDYDIVLDKKRIDDNYPTQNETGISFFHIIIALFIFGFIDIRFFRGLIILNILKAIFRGGGGGSGGSFGGGGRSGGGGAGGRW